MSERLLLLTVERGAVSSAGLLRSFVRIYVVLAQRARDAGVSYDTV